MAPNMGTTDRVLRTLFAAVIAVLYVTGRIGGVLGAALLIMAVIFTVTSLVSWCPVYVPFRISTRGTRSAPKDG